MTESKNGYVDWNQVPGSGDSSNTEFLALKSGNTYKIRPLLKPVEFYKFFLKKGEEKLKTAIVDEAVVSQMMAKYPELNKPAHRYAIYVIDRNDDNKIKIMEFPISVFRAFSNRYQVTQEEPGSTKNGSDWQIKKSGAGLKTSYETVFINNTPLTQEEIAAVKEELDGDKEKLATIFKFNDLASAEKKLGLIASDDDEGESIESNSVSNDVDIDVDGDDFDDPGW